jgi:hypothetical protein
MQSFCWKNETYTMNRKAGGALTTLSGTVLHSSPPGDAPYVSLRANQPIFDFTQGRHSLEKTKDGTPTLKRMFGFWKTWGAPRRPGVEYSYLANEANRAL